MGYPEKIAGGFLRAGMSTEKLARKGDMWGLYAQLTMERSFGGAEDPLVNAVVALAAWIGNRVVDAADITHGRLLVSGSVRLYPKSDCAGTILTPLKVDKAAHELGMDETKLDLRLGKAVLDLTEEHIGVRFYGDKGDLPTLRRDLGVLAGKLTQLPDTASDIIGVTNRDTARMAARLVPGLAIYTVSSYPYEDDVHAFGDAARLAHGRPLSEDRNMYGFSIPTEEFVNRFTSS